ncbi:hypothetical protein ACO2Q1_03370 [Brevundimonas sp. VNH65]
MLRHHELHRSSDLAECALVLAMGVLLGAQALLAALGVAALM